MSQNSDIEEHTTYPVPLVLSIGRIINLPNPYQSEQPDPERDELELEKQELQNELEINKKYLADKIAVDKKIEQHRIYTDAYLDMLRMSSSLSTLVRD
jgi:hypothetical protein